MADMKINFEGKEYDLDDFSLGELEWLEAELGDLTEKENTASIKAAVRFVTVLKQRENPEFTIEDARGLNLSVFEAPETSPTKRPTKAASGGSRRAASGATSSTKA